MIKKPGLDIADSGSHRPISNLAVISKLHERLVAAQLVRYLDISNLLPTLQSGFRPRYSTETAVLRVLSDILEAVDREVAVLALLDISAAFDTVYHDILIHRLQKTYKASKGKLYGGFNRTLLVANHSTWKLLFGSGCCNLRYASRVSARAVIIRALHC